MRSLFIWFSCLVVLIAIAGPATATRYTIIGGVVSDDTGAPIKGAEIELIVTGTNGQLLLPRHTKTDDLGRYSFQRVDAAGVSLRASNVGFKSSSTTLSTKFDKNGLLVIDLVVHKFD
jgi:hypothetical protein